MVRQRRQWQSASETFDLSESGRDESGPTEQRGPGADDGLDPNTPAVFPADDPPAGAAPVNADGGASWALAQLLQLRLFTELHKSAEGAGKWRAKICFAADFIVRVVVLLMLLAVIATIAWKTLAPLPPFWQ